ncbi:MAG: PDZ domain-containing protein [Pirellulales bacterium]
MNGRSQRSETRDATVEAKGFGFQVGAPSAAEKRALNGADGVLVVQVEGDGPAAAKGLEAGLMIRKVGSTTVTTVAEFEAALAKETSPDGVVFQVRSPAGGSRFVVIKPTA